METERAKQQVLDAALAVFGRKGIRFTMDDVAKEAGMSKKTLYVLFADKQALLSDVVEYCFASIKAAERQVIGDSSLSTLQKIQKILKRRKRRRKKFQRQLEEYEKFVEMRLKCDEQYYKDHYLF